MMVWLVSGQCNLASERRGEFACWLFFTDYMGCELIKIVSRSFKVYFQWVNGADGHNAIIPINSKFYVWDPLCVSNHTAEYVEHSSPVEFDWSM